MADKVDIETDPILDHNIYFEESRTILTSRLKKLSVNGSQKDKMTTIAQLAVAVMGIGDLPASEKLVKSCEKYIMSYGAPKEKGYLLFLSAIFLSAQAKYEQGYDPPAEIQGQKESRHQTRQAIWL